MPSTVRVTIIKENQILFRDLKPSDTFILEPNRTIIYTVIDRDEWNLYSRKFNKSANAVDQSGRLCSFEPEDVCKKVEVEINVIVKE